MSIIFSKYSNSKKEIASELSLIFMYLVIFCFVASGNAFGNSYVVDSLEDTDDNGAYIEDNSTNTLRKCIRLANDNAGSDTITFNISGIINAVSPPLEITDSGTIIDASSQWSGIWPNGTPGVTLNGNINMVTNGFVIQSACDCAISGLFITYFRDSGISIVDGSQNNIIGGASTGSRNVISGNNFGVFIAGINTNNNHVKGNYIGTNATGTSALGNADTGVCIDGGAQGNVIGGIISGERNVISGNWNGIRITGLNTNNNQVKGNYIGTNAAGTVVLGNQGGNGVYIYNIAQKNIIGGITSGESNVVSGYTVGVAIESLKTNNNQVKGNYIGTNAAGSATLGNFKGVQIGGDARSNVIGGSTTGEGNKIAYNNYGVLVRGTYTDFNIISHNSIHDNQWGLGIDLESGGNDEIAAPYATNNLIEDNLKISGYGAGANAVVEVFKADSAVSGEGKIYLGSLIADRSGNFSGFIDVTGKSLLSDDPIVLTTTHTDGNTSEFRLTNSGMQAIVVNPASLIFNAQAVGNNPASQILEISSIGNGTLDWSIDSDTDWLSYNPINGSCTTETNQVTISVDITGLNSGIYNGKLTISADGAINTPQEVPVTLNIELVTAIINLYAGWNLISCPIQPADNSIDKVLEPIAGKYNSVFAYNTQTNSWQYYIITGGSPIVNNLATIDPDKGYWLNMKEDATLTITGQPISDPTMPLLSGWNLTGYKGTDDKPRAEAISSISQYCMSMFAYDTQANEWQYYINAGGSAIVDDLDNMHRGKGYWINASSNCLWDPDSSSPTAPMAFSITKQTTPRPELPYIVYGNVEVDGVKVRKGFDHIPSVMLKVDGKTVLTYRMLSDKGYGEYYTFEVPVTDNSSKLEIYVELDGDISRVGELPIGLPGKVTKYDLSYRRTPKESRLLQNYPNPFNPETWIPYELSMDSEIKIMIYSLTGQLVRKLNLGHKMAGRYIDQDKSAYWDGKNEDGEEVSSGAYFYTLITPDFSQTRKLLIGR